MRVIPRHEQFINRFLVSSALAGVALVISLVTAGASAHAADSPAKVTVKVDEACSMSGHVDTEHTLPNPTIGAWNSGIGTTSITAVCNDAGGYDVYAVGYSNDEWKNTNLINTTDSSITIGTRDYDASYTSNSYWSMQLSQGTGDKATIVSPYDNYSAVPSDYTKVATYPSNTTGASGSSFKTTYGVYIANSQAIGTYQGQVKYTLVHPNGADAPEAKDPTPNIQDFTATMCQAQASTSDVTVTDSRDGKEYTVRYINGACWMTQNLAIEPGTEMTADDTNIASTYTSSNPYILPGSGYDLRIDGATSGTVVDGSTSTGNCRSTTNSSNTNYAGPGWMNACTHVATDTDVSDAGSSACGGSACTKEQLGAWYNYAAATAGTIYGTSAEPNTASTVDTYNICPKGWTLPANGTSTGQIGSVTSYASSFNPLYGGVYLNGSHNYAGASGFWWSATVYNARYRYYLGYNGGSLYTNRNYRYLGVYVRCVRAS